MGDRERGQTPPGQERGLTPASLLTVMEFSGTMQRIMLSWLLLPHGPFYQAVR